MRCKKCGAENLNSAKFCKSCGNQIPIKRNSLFGNKKKSVGILVLVLIVLGSVWFGYNYFENKKELARIESLKEEEKKKNLDVNYLKGLVIEAYQFKNDTDNNGKITEDHINKYEVLNQKFKTATDYFVGYAKEGTLDDNIKLKDFLIKAFLLMMEGGNLAQQDCENIYNGYSKSQSERFTNLLKNNCDISSVISFLQDNNGLGNNTNRSSSVIKINMDDQKILTITVDGKILRTVDTGTPEGKKLADEMDSALKEVEDELGNSTK